MATATLFSNGMAMLTELRSTILRCFVLVGLAGLAAMISNSLAAPARRLAWAGSIAPLPVLLNRLETPQPLAPPPPILATVEARPLAAQSPAPEPRTAHPEPTAPVPPPPTAQSPTAPSPASPSSGPIREISREEAWKAFQTGTPFLDARRSADYTEGHIKGAWCTPVWESDLDDRLITFKAARHPGAEDPIVIYCSGGDCRDSHLLASKLLNDGYFQLLIFRDGYPAWVALGLPSEKGQP